VRDVWKLGSGRGGSADGQLSPRRHRSLKTMLRAMREIPEGGEDTEDSEMGSKGRKMLLGGTNAWRGPKSDRRRACSGEREEKGRQGFNSVRYEK